MCSLETVELNVFDLNHMSYNAGAGVCVCVYVTLDPVNTNYRHFAEFMKS